MPAVRPTGELGPVGLILPTAPQGKRLSELGSTHGVTASDRSGATDGITSGGLPDARRLARTCQEAEAAGAGAIWAVDHLFWPRPFLECLTALAVAATVTRRAVLGSCVLQLPLRDPGTVAKQAAALQVLSGGRLVLGLGVGSHPQEYGAAGVDFAERGRLMDTGLASLRQAWSADGGPDHYPQLPAPAPIPVWVGGASGPALGRAATSADGWVPLFLTPAGYAEASARLAELTEAAGRPASDVARAVVLFVSVGGPGALEAGTAWLSSLYGIPPRAFARHLVAGEPAAVAAEVARYHEAGAEHVVVMVTDDQPVAPFAALVDALGAAGSSAPARQRPEPVEVSA